MTALEFSLDAQRERDRLAIEAYREKKERQEYDLRQDVAKILNRAILQGDMEAFDPMLYEFFERATDEDWKMVDGVLYAALLTGLDAANPLFDRIVDGQVKQLLKDRDMAEVQ